MGRTQSSVRRIFLSTLPARGATVGPKSRKLMNAISIHAPREGSDFEDYKAEVSGKISIHAPREGSDPSCSSSGAGWCRFLSTLPARGATGLVACANCSRAISIHAHREGSDSPAAAGCIPRPISTHAPREGSDLFFLSFAVFA